MIELHHGCVVYGNRNSTTIVFAGDVLVGANSRGAGNQSVTSPTPRLHAIMNHPDHFRRLATKSLHRNLRAVILANQFEPFCVAERVRQWKGDRTVFAKRARRRAPPGRHPLPVERPTDTVGKGEMILHMMCSPDVTTGHILA